MSAPPRIRVLGDHVINKIAAGEVVERPASVLKELVENALDAGADDIDVAVVGGGRSLVSVADNGHGMGRDDAVLSLERHATSKIADVDDIERIATLGFRGEALAAIAAVSRLTLATCADDTAGGTEVTVAGGKLLDVREAGLPRGTKLVVRNLFFNVPARRKFLRSEQTELSHLRQVFLLHALAHPATGFRLEVDGRELYRLPRGEALGDRLRTLFPSIPAASLRPVDHRAAELRVHGLAGVPGASRQDRSEQFLFVNGRPASAPVLHFAIGEAYRDLVPRGRHPVLFLFVDLPPGEVDVNVHPTKKEVRFRHAGAVRDGVIAALRAALARGDAEPPAGPATGSPTAAPPAPVLPIADLPPARVFSYPRRALLPSDPGPASRAVGTGPEPASPTPGGPWDWCRIVGQVGGLFVVLETGDGLVLMDPHAAHERILYERLMAEVLAHRVRGQGLLLPETVELSPADAAAARANAELLREMGFGLSEFGGDAFLVDAVPAVLGQVPVGPVLREVAQSAERAGRRGTTERWSAEAVAMAACKAAVKARDRLTLDEIEGLVRDLAAAEMPYTCPHGRPTLIHLSFGELNRKFGRA